MTQEHIHPSIDADYYNWLVSLVSKGKFSDQITYNKLLNHLYDTEFIYIHPKDNSRASDGVDLRYRFARTQGGMPSIMSPCSVLEMMVALAIRCEENIMDDPLIGSRLGQWFWGMVISLGLGSMNDDAYDHDVVQKTLERFLRREYQPNGKGGLFTIRNCDEDLRNAEIWYQLCWYLDCIT